MIIYHVHHHPSSSIIIYHIHHHPSSSSIHHHLSSSSIIIIYHIHHPSSSSIIGIPLKRVSIVSDDIEEIEAEVRRMSQKYDVVFTSGGIGPTHDDVTLKAIAKVTWIEFVSYTCHRMGFDWIYQTTFTLQRL